MENIVLLTLMVLLFVVPFVYIIIVDIIEISKRMNEIFHQNIKPAMASFVSTFVN